MFKLVDFLYTYVAHVFSTPTHLFRSLSLGQNQPVSLTYDPSKANSVLEEQVNILAIWLFKLP